MAVPYTFGSATTSIPLSQLDSNFATTITLGNTAIQLGNTVTTLNNMTLANATVSSGNATVLNATVTNDASISGLTVGKGGGADTNSTVVGKGALAGTNTVGYNTAFGSGTLAVNTSGTGGVAVGFEASNANTTGDNNTAVGQRALYTNTTGANNTALGYNALRLNTTASNNTAVGYQAGYSATVSAYNTFVGYQAGYAHNLGSAGNGLNTFIGQSAGYSMTGSKNTVIGTYNGNQAGLNLTTASNYIVLSDGDGNPRGYWDNAGKYVQNTNTNFYQIALFNNTNNISGNGTIQSSLGSNNSNTNSYHFIGNTNGTDRVYLYGNGNIVNSNNSYGTLSDAKLKENIVDATPKLDKILQLQVRNFNLKSDPLQKQIGFIAQEFEQVFPSMVDETQDRAEDGSMLETTTKSIKTSVLVPILVKAIQELKTIVDAQAAEIAELKAKVA